jgi:hypothetical protein
MILHFENQMYLYIYFFLGKSQAYLNVYPMHISARKWLWCTRGISTFIAIWCYLNISRWMETIDQNIR